MLSVARRHFARDGFSGTTIRSIATAAGVDASLVIQFFGSKDALFAEVRNVPATILERFDTAFEGPSSGLGERVVRSYMSAWQDGGEASTALRAVLRNAMVHEDARQQLRDFIESRLAHGLESAPDLARRPPETRLRAGLAAAMLVGVAMNRTIVGVPTLAQADDDAVVRILGPAIQGILVAD